MLPLILPYHVCNRNSTVCNRNRARANKVKGSLEEGAVDKLLVGELGEDRVQHGDGHQDLTHFLSDNINVISFHVQYLLPDNIIQS